MPRPKVHDEHLRSRLLRRASELLSTHGVAGLSVRTIAADVGTSTTAVYSLFGGKPELVNALYLEGFRRFGERLRTVERTGEPVDDIVRLCLAYREEALADRHTYLLLFTGHVTDFRADEETAARAMRALRPLWDVVAEGIDTGAFADVSTDVIAVSCWGCAHGLASLELDPALPRDVDFCQAFATSVRATASGWLRSPADATVPAVR